MDLDSWFHLRHGQSEANVLGLMCGRQCDSPLTETGRDQARAAAAILARTVAIHSICASPLHRAQETARIIASILSLPVSTIDELAEWDIGSWDHQPFIKVREEFLGSAEPPGGETRAAFARRVAIALDGCAAVQQPVLVVSHGGVWMAVQRLLGLDPVRTENAVPYRLRRD
ncbi:MAG TPA: histidine phosphatase family protein, partial [Chthoniobacterales bacterium]|nr:histidine phosphatase family protein [Chthoniobacterales bacterium]